jgi:hypothetical protein
MLVRRGKVWVLNRVVRAVRELFKKSRDELVLAREEREKYVQEGRTCLTGWRCSYT